MSTSANPLPSQPVRRRFPKPDLPYRSQLIRQLILLFITFITLFPILWIVSLSIEPSGIARPTELRLIPPGASLDAYRRVMAQPTNNPITFAQLAFNSFKLAMGVSLFSVGIGVGAAPLASCQRPGPDWSNISLLDQHWLSVPSARFF